MEINRELLVTVLASSVVAALVSAIIGPIVVGVLRRRDEVKQRKFEILYAEYKRYIERMESINQEGQAALSGEFLPNARDAFLRLYSEDPSEQAAALQEFTVSSMELLAKVTGSFGRAKAELQGLRIVCSDRVLPLVDDFVEQQQELMSLSSDYLQAIKLGPNATDELGVTIKVKGVRATALLELIIQQMRSELRIYK